MNKLVLWGLAGWLIYAGYNKKMDSTPVVDGKDTVVLEYETEVFPAQPVDQKTLAILKGMDKLNVHPDDAIRLARAYSQWSHQVANDTRILDLSQLTTIHKSAAEELLAYEGSLTANYKGALNSVIKDLYTYKTEVVKDSKGKITTTALGSKGSPVRAAMAEWMDAVSWKFADIFNDSIPETN